MLIDYKLGQGSIVLRVKILNSSVATGAGLTGLTSASTGLIISTIADNEATATTYTVAGSTIESISTLGTYASPTATKCRFKEVDATNHKGVYEIQIADARFAVSNAKSLLVSISGATNAAETDCVIPLRQYDPFGLIDANVVKIGPSGSGTAQTAVDLGGSRSEPAQGTPPASASFLAKIDWIYKAWRNKKTQTATTFSLFNDDAATVDHKATVSDDGTTTTIGEITTGP